MNSNASSTLAATRAEAETVGKLLAPVGRMLRFTFYEHYHRHRPAQDDQRGAGSEGDQEAGCGQVEGWAGAGAGTEVANSDFTTCEIAIRRLCRACAIAEYGVAPALVSVPAVAAAALKRRTHTHTHTHTAAQHNTVINR